MCKNSLFKKSLCFRNNILKIKKKKEKSQEKHWKLFMNMCKVNVYIVHVSFKLEANPVTLISLSVLKCKVMK